MPLITLLTDFGTSDSYVAEMKGVLLDRCPGAVLVDVTHAVPPGDVRAGAYLLGRAWARFPRETVHLAVVDPGVGTERAALALRAHNHWFVGPDNGLFTQVIRDAEVEVVVLPVPVGASPTFHGRDLFAPAAAALARAAELRALGEPLTTIPIRLSYTEPHYEGKSVVGEIVYVDRFGTLICGTGGGGPRDRPAAPHVRRRADRRAAGVCRLWGRGGDCGAGRLGGAAAGTGSGREDPGTAGVGRRLERNGHPSGTVI
jgi:S-adenosylmethionine hydrolase